MCPNGSEPLLAAENNRSFRVMETMSSSAKWQKDQERYSCCHTTAADVNGGSNETGLLPLPFTWLPPASQMMAQLALCSSIGTSARYIDGEGMGRRMGGWQVSPFRLREETAKEEHRYLLLCCPLHCNCNAGGGNDCRRVHHSSASRHWPLSGVAVAATGAPRT